MTLPSTDDWGEAGLSSGFPLLVSKVQAALHGPRLPKTAR